MSDLQKRVGGQSEGWTPGPWHLSRDSWVVFGPADQQEPAVCVVVSTNRHFAEAGANAHLIAAAPDLYDALSVITATLSEAFPALSKMEQLRKAESALAKALGA